GRRRHTRLVSDWSSDVCSSDLTLATGDRRWQAPVRGARLAVADDHATIIAATPRAITALDPTGRTRWQTPLPAAFADAAPDRIKIGRASCRGGEESSARAGTLH